jgi:hypothetical protein
MVHFLHLLRWSSNIEADGSRPKTMFFLCFSLWNIFYLHLSFAIFASLCDFLLVWNIPEACPSWFKDCWCHDQRATTFLPLFKFVLCFNWFVFSSLLIINIWIWQQGKP